MANSFPGSGLAYADSFSVGNASSVNSTLYVCSSCVQAVRIEHNYDQTNRHHNTLWLRANNAGCLEAASIGFTVVNNGGDHHRANIIATANDGSAGGNLALYTRRNDNSQDQLGIYINNIGNVSIGDQVSPLVAPKVDIRTSCPLTSTVGQPIFLGSNDVTGPLGVVIQHLCGYGVCRVDFTSTRYGISGNDLSLNVDSSDPNTAGGLYIKYRGNVGIGTSSPNTPLQIRNSSVSSGGSGLSVYGFDGAMEVYTTRAESPANAAIYLYNRPTSGTNGTGTGISFRASSTNTADRAQGGFYSSWTDTTDASRTSKFYFDLVCNGTYTTRMTLLGTGHLGVGTTTPGARVDVCGADGRIQSRVDSSDGSTINVRPNAGKCGWISYTEDAVADRWGVGVKNGDARLYFASGNVGSDGGTTRMVLDGTGNVGIGTTTPCTRLSVKCSTGGAKIDLLSITTTDGAGSQPTMRFDTIEANCNVLGRISVCDIAPYAGTMIFETSGCKGIGSTITTELMRLVGTTGNVGINTTTPSYRLHVNGTFYSAGSSVDYKQGISQYNTDSCLFMCLKPVTYQYKDEYTHLGKELKSETQIGLIAEDVADVYPELAILVNEEEQKVVRNVDYEKLSIILLSEVQKLRKEVDNLKNNK